MSMGNLILFIVSLFAGIHLEKQELSTFYSSDNSIKVQEIKNSDFEPNDYVNASKDNKTCWIQTDVDLTSHDRVLLFNFEQVYLADLYVQTQDNQWVHIGKTGRGVKIKEKQLNSYLSAFNICQSDYNLDSKATVRIKLDSHKSQPVQLYSMSYKDFIPISNAFTNISFLFIITIFFVSLFIILCSINFKDFSGVYISFACIFLGLDICIVNGVADCLISNFISPSRWLFKLRYFFICGSAICIIQTAIRIYSPLLKKIDKWNNITKNIYPIVSIFTSSIGFLFCFIPTNNLSTIIFMGSGQLLSLSLMIYLLTYVRQNYSNAKKIYHHIWTFCFTMLFIEQIFLYIRFVPSITKVARIFDNDFGNLDFFLFLLIALSTLIKMFSRIRSKFANLQIATADTKEKVLNERKNNYVYTQLSTMLANPMQIFKTKIDQASNIIPRYDYITLKNNLTYSEEIVRTLYLLASAAPYDSIIEEENDAIDLHAAIKEATLAPIENLRNIGCYTNMIEQFASGVCISANRNLLTVMFRFTLEAICKQVSPHSSVSVTVNYSNYNLSFFVQFESNPLTVFDSDVILNLEHFNSMNDKEIFEHGNEIIEKWGIYLFLVKKIATLYGGKVSITPGISYNLFSVQMILEPLPFNNSNEYILQEETVDDSPENSYYEHPDNNSVIVYILEENDSVRSSLMERFKQSYSVRTFSNSHDFLQKFSSDKPCIIICSITIPGKNSFELLQEYSQTYITPIFITAKSASKKTVDQLFEMGAIDVFIKPFSIDHLFNRVNAVIQSRTKYADKIVENIGRNIRQSIFDMNLYNPVPVQIKNIIENPETTVKQQNNEEKNTKPAVNTSTAHALFISANLTKKEWDIAELIIQGKSDKEIASALNISTGTVAVHNKKIYKKLNVHSRAQLIEKVQ